MYGFFCWIIISCIHSFHALPSLTYYTVVQTRLAHIKFIYYSSLVEFMTLCSKTSLQMRALGLAVHFTERTDSAVRVHTHILLWVHVFKLHKYPTLQLWKPPSGKPILIYVVVQLYLILLDTRMSHCTVLFALHQITARHPITLYIGRSRL